MIIKLQSELRAQTQTFVCFVTRNEKLLRKSVVSVWYRYATEKSNNAVKAEKISIFISRV